jgi:hypothetical protein
MGAYLDFTYLPPTAQAIGEVVSRDLQDIVQPILDNQLSTAGSKFHAVCDAPAEQLAQQNPPSHAERLGYVMTTATRVYILW